MIGRKQIPYFLFIFAIHSNHIFSAIIDYHADMKLIQKDSVFLSGVSAGMTIHSEKSVDYFTLDIPVFFYEENGSYESGTYGFEFHTFEKNQKSDLLEMNNHSLNSILWIDSFHMQRNDFTTDYGNRFFETQPLNQIMWNHPLYRMNLLPLTRIFSIESPWISFYTNSFYELDRFILRSNIQGEKYDNIFNQIENSFFLWYFNQTKNLGFGSDFKTKGIDLNSTTLGIFSSIEAEYYEKKKNYTNKNSTGVRLGLWNFEARGGYLLQTSNHPGSPSLSPLSAFTSDNIEKNSNYYHGFTLQAFWIYDLPFITDLIDLLINQIQFSPIQSKKFELVIDTVKEDNFVSSVRTQIAHYGRHFNWQLGYLQNKIESIHNVFSNEYDNFIFFQFEKPVIEKFIFLKLETYYCVSSAESALSSSFSIHTVF